MTTGVKSIPGNAKSPSQHHWRMVWAIARKDVIESVRSIQIITLSFLPVLIFLLYRLMVSGIDNSSILDIAVYDMGSSQLVSAMSQNSDFELHIAASEAALRELIQESEMSGLLIPSNFDAEAADGNKPELIIWLNPQRGLSSETVAWQRFIEAEIHQLGQQTLPAKIEWVDLETNTFSIDAELDNYLLIIALTMVFFLTGTNLLAMLITEEKEKKMALVLNHSPANPCHIVWGKVLASTIHILVVLALIILLNGGLTGNWPLALVYLLITLPVSLGAGILVGSVAQSSKQCSSWIGLGMIFFLIPAWFSNLIELPEPFHSFFALIPSQFLVQGLTDALNHSAVAATNGTNLIVWTVFMGAVVLVTFWRLRQYPQSIIA